MRFQIFAGKNTTGNVLIGYDAAINGNLSIGKDVNITGILNVKQYNSQNIITTTTSNYQLIVSEDISLNGRLFTSGNVAIGGTGAGSKLSVLSSSTNNYIQLGAIAETGTRALWLNYNGTGTAADYGVIQAEHQGTAYRNLALNPNGGYVGIGTSNPGVALDVVGNVRCTGGYELNYSALPTTFTPNQIGWRYRAVLASNIILTANQQTIFSYTDLPIGVYIVTSNLMRNAGPGQMGAQILDGSTLECYNITTNATTFGAFDSTTLCATLHHNSTSNLVKVIALNINGSNTLLANNCFFYITRIA